jgi:hypothetical protein
MTQGLPSQNLQLRKPRHRKEKINVVTVSYYDECRKRRESYDPVEKIRWAMCSVLKGGIYVD